MKTFTRNRTSLDKEWKASLESHGLFSVVDSSGEEHFHTSSISRDMEAASMPGEPKIRNYPIFAPDAIIHPIAGSLPKASFRHKSVVAYTDGSFRTNNNCFSVGSYAVCFVTDHGVFEYANSFADTYHFMGSNGAEMMAATIAIKEAIRAGYRQLEIAYDCQGVMSAAQDGSKHNWISVQFQDFVACASKYISISFRKVKAHSGDYGNEHANLIAQMWSRNEQERVTDFKTQKEAEELLKVTAISLLETSDSEPFTMLTSTERQALIGVIFGESRGIYRQQSEARSSARKKLGLTMPNTKRFDIAEHIVDMSSSLKTMSALGYSQSLD